MSLFFPRFLKGFGLHGMQEVGGSIPPGSTIKSSAYRPPPHPLVYGNPAVTLPQIEECLRFLVRIV